MFFSSNVRIFSTEFVCLNKELLSWTFSIAQQFSFKFSINHSKEQGYDFE